MRGIAEAAASASQRARRWDVVILGGALPGLVTAARLGLDGLRVLVVEEEAAVGLPPGLREPFLITGSGAGGILDTCMKALTVPLIERRKLEPDPVALQIVLPDVRIDVGDPITTAEELVAWGLAKPDVARALVRAIAEAGVAERAAMLDAAVIKGGGLRSVARAPGGPRVSRHGRGLPMEVASPPQRLRPVLDAQVRALSNLASASPPPEARGRLLASALEGAASYRTAEGFLRGCLRRRIQGLFGEFRTLPGRFDLVAVGNHPGITAPGVPDVWIGRALVLNAPRGCVFPALRELGGDPPDFLEAPRPTHRRVIVHLRARRSVLPGGHGAAGRRAARRGPPRRRLEPAVPCDLPGGPAGVGPGRARGLGRFRRGRRARTPRRDRGRDHPGGFPPHALQRGLSHAGAGAQRPLGRRLGAVGSQARRGLARRGGDPPLDASPRSTRFPASLSPPSGWRATSSSAGAPAT